MGTAMATMECKVKTMQLGSMRRHFLPVGQGAFYCETFMFDGISTPINVVFDCGTLPTRGMPKRIGNVVPIVFDKHKTIHIAFLSHLHEDHVNGLEELKKQHNVTIEEIRYPAVEQADQVLMDYWYRITGQQGGLAHDLCTTQPTGTGYVRFPGTRMVPVPITPPDEPLTEDSDPGNPAVADIRSLAASAGIPSNVVEASDFSDWMFWTFNYRGKEVVDRLESILGVKATNENLDLIWNSPGGKTRIKNAYGKAMPEGFNMNSMVVYSGPNVLKHQNWHQTLVCCHREPCHLECDELPFEPGCLYMGDFDASVDEAWQKMRERFDDCWQSIGCLQVPHHGACRNFNRELLKQDALFVASAGAHNQYGHPNACLQVAFQRANKHLFCVTEQSSSCLCTTVSRSKGNTTSGLIFSKQMTNRRI